MPRIDPSHPNRPSAGTVASTPQAPSAPSAASAASSASPQPTGVRPDGVDAAAPKHDTKPPAAPTTVTGLPATSSMSSAQRRAAITRSHLYHALPAAVRHALDGAMQRLEQHGSAADMLSLQRLLASPFWSAANAAQQQELLSVVMAVPLHDVDKKTPAQGRGVSTPMRALDEMAGRRINGQPMLLTQASDGTTLVHQLSRMAVRIGALPATNPVVKQTGLSPADIIGGAILEVNDPGRIAQGDVGTCAATCLQLTLIQQEPAEYVRLATGLVVDGQAKMADGDTLNRVPSSIPPTPGNSRTPTERLFQSALMAYGRDAADAYSIDIKQHQQAIHAVDAEPLWAAVLEALLFFPVIIVLALVRVGERHWRTFKEHNTGMPVPQIVKSGHALFGGAWESHPGGAKGVEQLFARSPDGAFQKGRVQVVLQWAKKGEMHAYHALRLVDIDTPESHPRLVYLHNPWGSDPSQHSGKPVGKSAPADALWVDPKSGVIALPYASFVKRLDSWQGPRQPGADGGLLNPYAAHPAPAH